MPYILSPLIHEDLPGLWLEDSPYKKESIYKIEDGMPPVNYSSHTLKSHSLTHIEAPLHVEKDGKSVDQYFSGNFFWGRATVVRLKGNNFKTIDEDKKLYHWEVTKEELTAALNNKVPSKLLLTVDEYPKDENGFHNPNYVLTLSQEAADWLVSSDQLNLYGTSWKSTDFKPGSKDRPIHKTIFKKAIILECLDLSNVPEGEYFLSAFPLRIKGSSESPLTPVLFELDEIKSIL